MSKRTSRLGAILAGVGTTQNGGRDPELPGNASIDIDGYRQAAQAAEANQFFHVAGPLNISRSRQGQPVIFQAGSSEDGRELAAAEAEGITLRETAWRFGARRSPFVGSPQTVADEIQRWFEGGAADGFNLRVSSPGVFQRFLSGVLPILRERGLVRTEHEHDTLRGHLGLPFPKNRYTAQRAAALELAWAPQSGAAAVAHG